MKFDAVAFVKEPGQRSSKQKLQTGRQLRRGGELFSNWTRATHRVHNWQGELDDSR